MAFAPENLGVPPEEIRSRVIILSRRWECTNTATVPHSVVRRTETACCDSRDYRYAAGLYCMDEATAMLDPRGRREVLETIKS